MTPTGDATARCSLTAPAVTFEAGTGGGIRKNCVRWDYSPKAFSLLDSIPNAIQESNKHQEKHWPDQCAHDDTISRSDGGWGGRLGNRRSDIWYSGYPVGSWFSFSDYCLWTIAVFWDFFEGHLPVPHRNRRRNESSFLKGQRHGQKTARLKEANHLKHSDEAGTSLKTPALAFRARIAAVHFF
jgi:hypothetical protein